ncbi:hypothetical protein [Syntrophotalea acetylenica]|uniref:hypothetical protein n=1 Tax=Syntrophotalea acetylenica TaxID=29542 RepID=UPI002A36E8FF|nr:hypothetical protein [Syntrophotalea acetylenica]MDY0261390.1 hypothetical protein [Syntrophotalea acetylenica]
MSEKHSPEPPHQKQVLNNQPNFSVVVDRSGENPLIPFVKSMNRSYDFSSYETTFGHETTKAIASAFKKWLGTYKPGGHIIKYYVSTCDFLDYVKQIAPERFPAVLDQLREGKKPSQFDWQNFASAYRSTIIDPNSSGAKATKNGRCNRTSSFLQQLNIAGIAPKVVFPGVRHYRGAVQPTKGAAELVRGAGRAVKTEKNANPANFGTNQAEKLEIQNIISALGAEGVTLSVEDPDFAERAMGINNSRLAELHKCAMEELLQWWEIFQKGQDLLASCDLSYQDDMLPLLDDYLKKFNEDHTQFTGKRGHRFTKLFDDKNVELELRQARFLTFIEHRYCGIYPDNAYTSKVKSDWEIVIPLNKRGKKLFGSRTKAMAHINAKYDALLCACIILLIDTNLNVSTIEELPHDCLIRGNEPETYFISGWKDRARGQEKPARVNEETANIVNMVLEMTSRYRRVAATGGDSDWRHPLVPIYGKSLGKRLFLTSTGRPLYGIGEFKTDSVRKAFENFLARHDCLAGIPWTYAAIRNSAAQKKFWEGGLNIVDTTTELGHAKGSRCTGGYVMRRAAKQQLEREIRRFQILFEAACVADIPGAAEALGYSEKELSQLIDEACRSGLGVVCWKKIQEEKNGQVSSKTKCNPREDCPKCSFKKIVPASTPNLVDLILHHDYLEDNKSEMLADNPDRWIEVHLPWLAFAKAALEKVKLSNLVSPEVLRDAKIQAALLKPVYPPII